MRIQHEPYPIQVDVWPPEGRHILAQFDSATVIVYQAYKPSIGEFAASHGRFGGDFSYSRMSWIKPNFLWMMFRSGWGTKPDQEVTLALHLQRRAFDAILAGAVASSFSAARHLFDDEEKWKAEVARSEVRLQWDPDHHPSGAPLARRALQLGLRGEALRRFGGESISRIEDVSAFVREQRVHVEARAFDRILLPRERVYPVADEATRRALGLSAPSAS